MYSQVLRLVIALVMSASGFTGATVAGPLDWLLRDDGERVEDPAELITRCHERVGDDALDPSSAGTMEFFRFDGHLGACIYGSLAALPAERIQRLAVLEPDVLVVRSAGGPVRTWLDLAEALRRRPRSVIVDGLCASSCANYVFPTGREKIVPPGSLVIWHGGPVDDAETFLRVYGTDNTALASFLSDGARSEALYRRWEINPEILSDTLGQAPSLADIIVAEGYAMDQLIGFALPPGVLGQCYGFDGLERYWHAGTALDVFEAGNRQFANSWIALQPSIVAEQPCSY